VLHVIWLVIGLGRDILPTYIFTKFDDYTMKTNWSYWTDKCSGRRSENVAEEAQTVFKH